VKPTSTESSCSQWNAARTQNFTEVIVAIAASAIMALMVVGGGIAVEGWTSLQASTADESPHEPAPLSWREST
jgi:hypothetical protein